LASGSLGCFARGSLSGLGYGTRGYHHSHHSSKCHAAIPFVLHRGGPRGGGFICLLRFWALQQEEVCRAVIRPSLLASGPKEPMHSVEVPLCEACDLPCAC